MFQCANDMRCPDGVFNTTPEVPLLYIWGRTFEVYEVANGFLFCHTKPFFTIMISSLTLVRMPMKVGRLWREAFKGLYGYLLLMDIVCLRMMSVLTHQVSWTRGLAMPTSTFSGFFVGPCTSWPEVIDKGPNYMVSLLSGFYVGARCPLMLVSPRGAVVKV